MLCPNCGKINKDDARECRVCGMRMSARYIRDDARQKEKKYLTAGIAATLGIILIIVMLSFSLSCICGGCERNAGEEDISNADGDWSGEAVVSDGEPPVSPADAQ